MKTGLCALAALVSLLGAAQAETDAGGASPAIASQGLKIAQACGYFAMLGCFREQAAAQNWNEKIEFGEVVDTTDPRFPHFTWGYFCVVHGPVSRERAEEIARKWRTTVPDAYVKSNC